MDFDTFTTDTLNYLWRKGDTVLSDTMPQLVKAAENRIRVDLKLKEEEVTLEATATDEEQALPADCDIVHTVEFVDRGVGTYTTLRDFTRGQPRQLVPGSIYRSKTEIDPLSYTVRGKTLLHHQPLPADFILTYTPTPASLVDDDDTLHNLYTDLYQAAVYTECCLFLMDEQRAGNFDAKYRDRLDGARTEQNYRRYGEGPLKMQMPRRDVC